MSEHNSHNPVLRFSRALRDLIGRLGLSTTDTAEFAAVGEGESGGAPAPRPDGYTPIPDRRNGFSFGVFEPPVLTDAERRSPLTRAQVEDRAAANAAMKAEGFPKGQIPSVFSPPRSRKT